MLRALKSLITRIAVTNPFGWECKVLNLLALRYSLRSPLNFDSPSFASLEDIKAPLGILNRSGMIALAFQFMYGNHIKGDYLEFGCWTGRTFRMAYHHHKAHFAGQIHFWLFDSFAGLPQLTEIDEHPKWKSGNFRTSLQEFIQIADSAGIPTQDYTVVSGFYNRSLTPVLADRIGRVGIVYIDCDLYESTREVLAFVKPLFQEGTVLCFDDYYCFNGNPDRGEQRAIREFLAANRNIEFVEYARFGWHGKSFIVHLKDSA